MLNKDLDKLIDEFMDANNNEVSINETASYFYELGKQAMKEQMGEQARKELAKTDITLADLVAFDEGFKLGRRLERQDMLNDAVEGEVAAYENGKIRIYTELLDGTIGLHFGDKIKIIIVPIKEDKE